MPGRAACVACLVGLLPLSGCIVPYAYPTLSYTPSLPIGAHADEVHVFRVNVENHLVDIMKFRVERISEVPLKDAGKIPSQVSPGMANGVAMYFIALNYDFRSTSTIRLRIYRPGFELIEVNSWDAAAPIEWTPARDLYAQRCALDGLFPAESIGPVPDDSRQRAALSFGAAEYRRLAESAAEGEEREKLERRAVRLEELADGRGNPPAGIAW